MTRDQVSCRDGVDPALLRRAEQRFAEQFGAPGPRLAVAPGRVNLIGEHTDYNDGFVLPMAIGRCTAIAFRPRADRRLRAHAVAFGETKELDLADLAPPGGSDWLSYVAGVAWALAEEGFQFPGLDAVVDGDVPIGAGLSSSASLELAAARAFAAAGGLPWDAVRMAKLGQKAENRYVGMNCGLMDQFASAVSREGCALLLDCRSLAAEPVPVPAGAAVVVMDTGARRALAGSAYNDRRSACEAAVARGARPSHRPRPRPAGLLRGPHDGRRLRRLRGGPRPGGRRGGLRHGRAGRLSREGRLAGGLVRLPAHGGSAAPRLNTRRKAMVPLGQLLIPIALSALRGVREALSGKTGTSNRSRRQESAISSPRSIGRNDAQRGSAPAPAALAQRVLTYAPF